MAKAKVRRRRARNTGEDSSEFPLDTWMEVEAMKIKSDGTIDVVVRDEELGDVVAAPVEVANRRRRSNRRR